MRGKKIQAKKQVWKNRYTDVQIQGICLGIFCFRLVVILFPFEGPVKWHNPLMRSPIFSACWESKIQSDSLKHAKTGCIDILVNYQPSLIDHWNFHPCLWLVIIHDLWVSTFLSMKNQDIHLSPEYLSRMNIPTNIHLQLHNLAAVGNLVRNRHAKSSSLSCQQCTCCGHSFCAMWNIPMRSHPHSLLQPAYFSWRVHLNHHATVMIRLFHFSKQWKVHIYNR